MLKSTEESFEHRFQRGVAEFNAKKFFQAHEAWEELWHEYRGDDRQFLQGLIQIAAGFYHTEADNVKGAVSQLTKGMAKLRQFGPAHLGINVEALLHDVRDWLGMIETRQQRHMDGTYVARFPGLIRESKHDKLS